MPKDGHEEYEPLVHTDNLVTLGSDSNHSEARVDDVLISYAGADKFAAVMNFVIVVVVRLNWKDRNRSGRI